MTDEITQRGFINWIQFGITITGNVTNNLTGCTIEGNFYGGGNLATVDGTVTSTLTNTTVKGNAFGAGFSAEIPTFSVHNKSSVSFPSIDFAGTITDGNIDYVRDDDVIREYEWTNDLDGLSEAARKASPGYQKNGKWYCYTWNSLSNLGAVLNAVTLTLKGNTTVGSLDGNSQLVEGTGDVFGGGEESAVNSNTTVLLQQGTTVLGNVFGGGNNGTVGGNSEVKIQDE